jgi:hypothetical protein
VITPSLTQAANWRPDRSSSGSGVFIVSSTDLCQGPGVRRLIPEPLKMQGVEELGDFAAQIRLTG